jgi:hypothetical protein
MMAKYTKKAFNDIFNYLRDDDDFRDLFREYWGKKNPERNAAFYETDRAAMGNEYKKTLGDCITDYLYNGFDYLDKEYLDISWLRIKQNGRFVLVDIDTIYDIFTNDLREKLNEQ